MDNRLNSLTEVRPTTRQNARVGSASVSAGDTVGDFRLNDMLARYGEVCTQKDAAHILQVVPRTIATMLDDGRLRRVAHRVDVRSIYDYIMNPHRANFNASVKKSHPRSQISDGEFFAAAKRGKWGRE